MASAPSSMYTVERGTGRTDRLFASPGLHRALQSAGVSPGSELRITATRGERRRRVWLVTPAQTRREAKEAGGNTQDKATSAKVAEPPPEQRLESPRPHPANGNEHRHQAPDEAAERQPAAELAAVNGNGDGKPPLPRELEQMGQLMGLCLHASTIAWKHIVHGRQSPGDVRAVAITLFLECSRRGVTAEELLEGIPF